MYTLNNWAVVGNQTPYQAPEMVTKHLSGQVYGHPRFADGEVVTTSAIVKVDGKQVQTASGSAYILGEPSAEWVGWLAEQGVTLDPTNPIKVA